MTAGCVPAASGSSTHSYGEAWYWDTRYSQDSSPFDWYQKYPSLAPLIRLHIPCHHRVLVVGCGNSTFSEGMIDDGYNEVVNVDVSSVVIEAMKKKYSNNPRLIYMKMDVRDMSALDASSFDAVIDKGTLDSLMCGQNSKQHACKMLEEVCRVLKDKGVYILITYGSPLYRLPLLRDSYSWAIKLHVIEKLASENSSNGQTRDLTSPIPLDADWDSPETALGKNADVHYIYICVKDDHPGKSAEAYESIVEKPLRIAKADSTADCNSIFHDS